MSTEVFDPPTLMSVTRDYLELSKARIVMMVLITTAAGYLVGARHVDPTVLLHLLVGTALVAGGTNALNQYAEREHDAKMVRTRHRPLPDGRLSPRAALSFAIAIAVIGTAYLALAVNPLTALLGAITLVSYIFLYTPLKRRSTACTLVGAIPGAIPPLMGWAAATGSLGWGGWAAFAILFLWQLPHFMAISWIYRDDYARAGFEMTSVRDPNGVSTARQAVFFAIALVAASMVPGGVFYRAGAFIAGAALVYAAITFLRERSNRTARQLFLASNLYLIVLMVLLVGCDYRSDLPRLFAVPGATLVSDSGKPLNLESMKGYVTVYDFIFTNCGGTCPMMTSNMRRLTAQIDKGAPVRFVSISVDPERDTPAALRSYASHVRNDQRWVFLTGKKEDIVRLSVEGFKLAAGGTPQTAAEPLLHSSRFAIADKDGMIREYFDATEGDAPAHVAQTVKDLLRE
jgi:protoheme IX farnesyltransferase